MRRQGERKGRDDVLIMPQGILSELCPNSERRAVMGRGWRGRGIDQRWAYVTNSSAGPGNSD